jgi:hypothetical protein
VTTTFEVHRTEVDGVPTFWADPPAGPYIGGLMFRVGRSDEPPAWGGITHLVEHLALAPLGQQSYDHNGMVEPNRTLFHAVGDADEVTSFLHAVTAGIRALPLERLLIERRILGQEEAQSNPSIGGLIRGLRYGMTSHGQIGEDQAGLNWLGPDTVAAWARDWFTRGNAALFLSGPPPAGLRIDLPEGQRQPIAPIEDLDDVIYPAHAAWQVPGTTLSMRIGRAIRSTVLGAIVERRARQKLRFERGLVYDVHADYDVLSGKEALMVIGSDCPPSTVPEVSTVLLGVLDDLASNGPTPDELRVEAEGFRRQFTDPAAHIGYLDRLCDNLLSGGSVPDPDDVAETRANLQPADIAEGLREAMDSLLLVAAGDPPDGRFHPYPHRASAVAGTEYRPAGRYLPGRGPKERLICGPDGVSLVGGGDTLSVRFAETVLLQHYAGEARVLWARNGQRLGIRATDWQNGTRVVEQIDRSIDAEVVACDEHGVGALPDPELQVAT